MSVSQDYDRWKNQFVLTRGVSDGPTGWVSQSLNAWHLHVHESLPAIPIRDQEGQRLGWILGWPISLTEERILKPDIDYVLGPDDQQLYDLAGRWLALVVGRNKVYNDAAGSISAVYLPDPGIVASSTGLLPEGAADPEHSAFAEKLRIPQEDNWYPFGLTSHPQARRLFPNYSLDLETFEKQRVWPVEVAEDVSDTDSAIDRIIELSRIQLSAITRDYDLKGNITGGFDTRTILALGRPFAKKFRFATRNNGRYGDAVDANTARQVAKDHDLDLTIMRERQASQEELDEWQMRTGHCIAGAVWRSVATWKHFEPGRSNITGIFPPLKGFYKTAEPLESVPGKELLRLLQVPSHPYAERAAESWVADVRSVPGITKRQVLDLLQLEQRSGCWASPTLYGNDDTAPPFWLLAHREIIDLMLRVPEDYKVQKGLPRDIIRRAWPELLKYRFNAPSGMRGLPFYAYGAFRLARSKMRQAIGR